MSRAADAGLALRRALLLSAGTAAAIAVLAGLARLGVAVGPGPRVAADHGPLFVLAVFGTAIALERAVALGPALALVAPALFALFGLARLAGLDAAPWLAVAASLALLTLNLAIVRRQSSEITWLMALGSLLLVLGAARWALGHGLPEVALAFTAFFVLTIVAERLELSRLAPTPRLARQALVALAVLFAALAAAHALSAPTARAVGVTAALLGLWELRFDLARRTLRRPGLPRFAATGVLLGAGWLTVFGLLLAAYGLPPAGAHYDAILHTLFVGFVLSMVFAHAPIILPAVARVEAPFTPLLHAPLALLHLGLVARVGGDLLGLDRLRLAGGVGSAVALGLFAITLLAARLAHVAPLTPRRSP